VIVRRQGVDLQGGRDIILGFQPLDRLAAIATPGLGTSSIEAMELSFDLPDDNQSHRLGDGDRVVSVEAVTAEGQTRNSLVIGLVEAMNMPHISAQTITLFGVTDLAPDAISNVGSRSIPVLIGMDHSEAFAVNDEALVVLTRGGNDSVQGEMGCGRLVGGDGDTFHILDTAGSSQVDTVDRGMALATRSIGGTDQQGLLIDLGFIGGLVPIQQEIFLVGIDCLSRSDVETWL
jgi:hypothetical protein